MIDQTLVRLEDAARGVGMNKGACRERGIADGLDHRIGPRKRIDGGLEVYLADETGNSLQRR